LNTKDRVRILHENCDPKLAEDTKLPYTAYLVQYIKDGKSCYDLTMCNKTADMFDHYYDNYKKEFKGWVQSQGRCSPRTWGHQNNSKKKKG